MVDRIVLEGLEAFAHHGVLPHEKRIGQRFVVDVAVELDLSEAGRTDRLDQTLDYGRLAVRVHEVLTGGPHELIETVAERIADAALEDSRADAVEVVVRKPQAPLTVAVQEVRIEIRRERTTGDAGGAAEGEPSA